MFRRQRRRRRYEDEFPSYVSDAERRGRAERDLAALRKAAKDGAPPSPVVIDGRHIATTFWGKAWCENLERYSDYENRLPRGRSYVRSGAVLDLQIAPGLVRAVVSGTTVYDVRVKVEAVPVRRWRAICEDCSGAIDSVVSLLQGRLSDAVMTRLCEEGTGLFPLPKEITLRCTCPDAASMCKHVAAVLYGIGARLDHDPRLLFTLRQVREQDLIAQVGHQLPAGRAPASGKVLQGADLSELFGIEIVQPRETTLRNRERRTRGSTRRS